MGNAKSDHGGQAPTDTQVTAGEFARDPFPLFERYRQLAPVIKVESLGHILVTRSRDVDFVREHPEIFGSDITDHAMRRAFRGKILNRQEGPEHLRNRGAMAPAFSQDSLDATWAPLLKQIAADYLDALPEGEEVDLHAALAGPFAARGLSTLLGTEIASDSEMIRWSTDLMAAANSIAWEEELFRKSDIANDELDLLLDALIASYRSEPNASALSGMVNTELGTTASQVAADLKIALSGGIVVARDALSTTLFALLTHPNHLKTVQDTGSWDLAFNEAMRWMPPVQSSPREVLQEVELHDVTLKPGDRILAVQASANRDESVFADGHLFDPFRRNTEHKSFGAGIHACLGEAFVRTAVGKIMVPMLFERFPDMKLLSPGAIRWRGICLRGPESLVVRLR